jgi:cytochrome c peroxidase
MAGGDLEWRFLTTTSEVALRPILDAYGQSVIVERDGNGNATGTIAHILRVFLIDSQRRVRNVYSVSFLHADTLAADLRTVLMEAGAPSPLRSAAVSALRGPGDDRSGYERSNYRSRSLALASRTGAAADLVSRAESPPLGLPALPIPPDNPLTRAKVELGRKLFFDRRLSLNQTLSCAMCHIPEQGFTNNELATAVGLEGRTVRRNSPTLLNVGHQSRLFHDGREDRLEHQIWGPLLASNEMANPSVGAVLARIRGAADYDGTFEASFPERGLSMESVGMALASYERTLVSGDSAFDRWRYGGEEDALSATAQRGFAIFAGKGGCLSCHPVGEKSALFTDGELHNTGIGYRQSMGPAPSKRRIQVAPGQWLEVEAAIVARVSDPVPGDLGYYEITQDPSDRWKYRTPTLREVARTAPYMHDGSLPSLLDVVHFYNEGGVPNETLDPAVRPLGLSDAEVDDLVAFLEALGGSDVDTLVSDAFAAPVGDPAGLDGASSLPSAQ